MWRRKHCCHELVYFVTWVVYFLDTFPWAKWWYDDDNHRDVVDILSLNLHFTDFSFFALISIESNSSESWILRFFFERHWVLRIFLRFLSPQKHSRLKYFRFKHMLASRPHVLWTALTRCDTFFGFSGWNSYNLQTKVLSTIFQKKKQKKINVWQRCQFCQKFYRTL